MRIEEIINKTNWDEFATDNGATFLQSWEWGEFNRELGHGVSRFGIYEGANLIGCFLLLKIVARRGTFLFIPHGPIVKKNTSLSDFFKQIIPFLKKQASEQNCSFIRISPFFENNQDNNELFKTFGFISAPMHMHSELCWVLDIRPSEEVLSSGMRKTTRYLVKQQQKYNIVVEKSESMDDFDVFYSIYHDTEKRQKFVGFGKDYLKHECSVFLDSGRGAFYFAKHDNKPVAAAFIITYGNSGYYHQGATLLTDPKIPVAYVLQWEIIKDLKKNGFNFYNFWGISPDAKLNHPWYGLSKFKRGYGGFEVDYMHAKDLVIKHGYWINWFIEMLRKMKRGY